MYGHVSNRLTSLKGRQVLKGGKTVASITVLLPFKTIKSSCQQKGNQMSFRWGKIFVSIFRAYFYINNRLHGRKPAVYPSLTHAYLIDVFVWKVVTWQLSSTLISSWSLYRWVCLELPDGHRRLWKQKNELLWTCPILYGLKIELLYSWACPILSGAITTITMVFIQTSMLSKRISHRNCYFDTLCLELAMISNGYMIILDQSNFSSKQLDAWTDQQSVRILIQ